MRQKGRDQKREEDTEKQLSSKHGYHHGSFSWIAKVSELLVVAGLSILASFIVASEKGKTIVDDIEKQKFWAKSQVGLLTQWGRDALLRRFPKYGTEQFQEECWTTAIKNSELLECTIFLRPSHKKKEGIA